MPARVQDALVSPEAVAPVPQERSTPLGGAAALGESSAARAALTLPERGLSLGPGSGWWEGGVRQSSLRLHLGMKACVGCSETCLVGQSSRPRETASGVLNTSGWGLGAEGPGAISPVTHCCPE